MISLGVDIGGTGCKQYTAKARQNCRAFVLKCRIERRNQAQSTSWHFPPLSKIYFENDFSGRLENGYWLEDDAESGEIISITIFIKELEDEDVFFRYDWCSRSE